MRRFLTFANSNEVGIGRIFLPIIVVFALISSVDAEGYRGFLPVTEKEAMDFAHELETKVREGDKALLYEAGTDLNAYGAYYTFRGVEIPNYIKSATGDYRTSFSKRISDINYKLFEQTASVQFDSLQQKGQTCRIIMKFDKFTIGETVFVDKCCTFSLVKRKSDNRVFIALYRCKRPGE